MRLPGIGSFFGSLIDPLIAITAVTAAVRPGLLPSTVGLARSVSALPHEEPRSFRSFAQ